MDFPSRPSNSVSIPPEISRALGVEPIEVLENAFNYMAVLESADAVRACTPAMAELSKVDRPGVVITAVGDGGFDFVSRYFAPRKGIPEDPVTGATHCMLAPYWSRVLKRSEFRAFQASRRGGVVLCRLKGERVELEGTCVFVIEGTLTTP
jgi:predicted PhzF superfamily epimerase YddE/YHI9